MGMVGRMEALAILIGLAVIGWVVVLIWEAFDPWRSWVPPTADMSESPRRSPYPNITGRRPVPPPRSSASSRSTSTSDDLATYLLIDAVSHSHHHDCGGSSGGSDYGGGGDYGGGCD